MNDLQKQIPISINKPIDTGTNIISTDNANLNLHVYTNDDLYISSNYNLTNWKYTIQNSIPALILDIHTDARDAGFYSGQYKLKYILEQFIVGSNLDTLFIYEISNDRTELLLIPTVQNDIIATQIKKIKPNTVTAESKITDNIIIDYDLNLFNNDYNTIINFLPDINTGGIYVKLNSALDSKFDLNTECFITYKLSTDIIIDINLITSDILTDINILKQPNFNIKINRDVQSNNDYQSYNDITHTTGSALDYVTNYNISDYVMSSYSSSLQYGIKLNIDYADVENFIY